MNRDDPIHSELNALRQEVDTLRLTNSALQQRLSADAAHYDAMLRELEIKGNELRTAGRRQLDLAAFTQRVIDAVGALVIVLDNDGAIIRINLAASIFLGIRMPVVEAYYIDAWLAEDELAQLATSLEHTPWQIKSVVLEGARNQGQYRGEHRLRNAAGQWHYFLLETTLLYNRQGKEEGAVVCATNIQAIKDAEVDLRLADSVFENSRNGITITNSNSIIERVNGAFTEILGYEPHECIGQPVSLVKSGLHDEAFYQQLWSSLNTLGRWQGEIINRCKDGSLVHLWQSISSVRGNDGVTTHYAANFVDISEQKALERELRAARDSAEAASRAKGDFLANMSHEIRTPMNGIIGLLKLLMHTSLDTTQHDYVQKAKGAAGSLLGILNDILDYSKVAAGKMQLERQPFSLSTLLQDVGVIASANLGEKQIELVYAVDPAVPPYLMGDSLRLKQVLTNLIGNSIKFTAVGEVVVGIRAIESSADEVCLEFSVRDTGIGIPPDKLATVFESFGQADSSTTRKFGGTGLGLAISQSLVTLMGGQLRVESSLGQGSRFAFNLPLGRTDQAEGVVKVEEGGILVDPHTGLPVGRHLRTLIVDDNDTARTEMRLLTERFGWPTSVAASAEDALALHTEAKAEGNDFQLIFMDWRMPGMDGITATRRLRAAQEGGRRPVIILLTAFDPGVLLQGDASIKSLFDSVLMKPVTESTVFDTVLNTRAGHARSAPRAIGPGARRLAGLRILVVDDNALNRQVAQGLLSLEGAIVELADGGFNGIARIEDSAQVKLDVVLMDVQMPDIDGYEATRRLRAAGCTLPILAMTANVMATDVAAAQLAGMDGHIAKPIDLDDLVAKIAHGSGGTLTTAESVMPAPDHPQPATPAAIEPAGASIVPPVIDVQGALRRMGGMDFIYREAVNGFFTDTKLQLDTLRSDLLSGQLDSGRRIVHTVKGLAAMVGATDLAALALRGEMEWKNGVDLMRGQDILLELEQELALASTALQAVLRQFDEG